MTATPLVGTTFFGLDVSRFSEQFRLMRRRVSKRVLLLEFAPGLLRLAEAVLTPDGVQLNHISKINLPDEALDRGVPADPAKMAGLLKELCREKAIPAHRVAVVLSPEAAFQRLVDLPAELTTEQAREFVLDPANGVQIPFPLAQTDFDLTPVTAPPMASRPLGMRLYMLSAVPQVLVDQVIEMLRLADLELQLLELGSFSQLRPIAADLLVLPPQKVDLVLELLPDCSTLMFVSSSGLLGSERLASIRDFPEPELDDEQANAALEAGLSAEAITVQDDRYLPLSDLDLRVLVDDLRAAIGRFMELFPGAQIRTARLTGINSAHPLLVELLEAALSLSVVADRPLLAPGVTGFAPDQVLVQTGLARLVGLGLALLPRQQLVGADVQDHELPSLASDPLAAFDAMPAEVGMAPVPSLPNAEDASALEPTEPSDGGAEAFTQSPVESIEAVVVSVDDVSELDEREAPEEWPSIASGVSADGAGEEKGEALKLELVEEASEVLGDGEEKEAWPSIGAGLVADGVSEEKGEELKLELEEEASEVVVDLEEDEEWPSIGAGVSADGAYEEKGEELKLELVEEASEVVGDGKEEEAWPSIDGSKGSLDGVRLSSLSLDSSSADDSQSVIDQLSDLVIPGLPVQAIKSAEDAASSKRQEIDHPDVNESSLGPLRFAEEIDS